MQIGSTSSINNQLASINKTASSEPSKSAKSGQSSSSFESIAAKYDMNNISPREIDQLVDHLRDSGNTDWAELGMLSTRGEKFRSAVSQSMGGSAIDPNQKSDLIASVEYNVELNRRNIEPFEMAEDMLKFIRKIDVANVIGSKGVSA